LYRCTGRWLVKSPKPELGAEASRAADEGVASFVEAKEAVRCAGDADARAFAEDEGSAGFGYGTAGGDDAEPERAWGAEIRAVEGAVDAESGGEAAWTAREVEHAGGFAVPLHLLDALEGFERADQDATADTGDFRADVEHEMIAVAEIDVGVAAEKKHGAIARGRSAKVVRGRIALRVGFGLHNAAAKPGVGELADDNFADEKAG